MEVMGINKAYVITSLQSWDDRCPGYAQYLARELAQTDPVLYVNPPLDLLALLAGDRDVEHSRKNRVLRGSEPAIRRLSRWLWVLEPPVVLAPPVNTSSEWIFDLFNRRNNRRYADAINWALECAGLEIRYLLIDNDIFRSLYLDDYLVPELSIYYRRGNFTDFALWRRHGVRAERELLRRSDLVVASSDYLTRQVAPYNVNTYNIGRGVDLTGYIPGRFRPFPPDLIGIRGPVIGMTGLLGAMHVSADLLYRLARTYPDCSLVLVGGQDEVFARHSLHRLENVYFLGEKPTAELPAYVSRFDLCISPEPQNEVTAANFPDEVVHYLRMGKRVVAMDTGALEEFRGRIHLAEDEAHFLGLVGIALYESIEEACSRDRSAFAATFSWAVCATRLRSLIAALDDEFYHAEPDLDLKADLCN